MGKSKRCVVISYGYQPPYPEYASVAQAKAAIREMKAEDLKACRRKFGYRTKVTPLKKGYIIGFGDNVYSSAYYQTID